jgi:hypothetical protein
LNKKFHLSISVTDLDASIADYSQRLGHHPWIVVPHEYALWRTETLNFSIRLSDSENKLRHLGWEDESATEFSQDVDVNGIIWERFTANQQQQEIESIWSKKVIKNEERQQRTQERD